MSPVFQRRTTGSVVCPSCGSLVGVRDDKCYSCGRSNPGLWGFGPALRQIGINLGFANNQWNMTVSDFHEGRAPQDVGFAFAGVWQGVIDVARSVADLKLPIDISVAAWKSPSESGATVQ